MRLEKFVGRFLILNSRDNRFPGEITDYQQCTLQIMEAVYQGLQPLYYIGIEFIFVPPEVLNQLGHLR